MTFCWAARVCGQGAPGFSRRERDLVRVRAGHQGVEDQTGERGHRGVGAVAEGDHADAGGRVPAHVRAEAGVSAAVRDDPAEGRVLVDEQAEAVVLGRRGRAARQPPGRPPAGYRLRQLHLPARRRAERVRVAWVFAGGSAGGCVGRERGREPGHPAGEVGDGREDAAHRRERAVRVERDLVPACQSVPVADGEVAVVELVGGEAGPFQAERGQQPGSDELVVEHAGRHRQHPAEDRVAEVGVLEPGPRRPVERDPGRQQLVERGDRQPLLPVPPRVVGREPGRHRQQLPDRHRGGVGRPVPPAVQLGHVLRGRVVERERAGVAQQQDGRRGERLGHRRDPKHRARVGRPGPEHPGAEPGTVHQPAPGDDAVGDRGLTAPAEVVADDGVRRREIVGREMVTVGQVVYRGVTRHSTILARQGMRLLVRPGTPQGRLETWRI